jgi:hypothetical protein
MSDFRKTIAEELREKRPNISDSSEKLIVLLILTDLSEYSEDMLAFAKEVNDTYKKQKNDR